MADIDYSRAATSSPGVTLRTAGEAPGNEPTLLPTVHPSLIDGQDDLAALLASVMRRQVDRRAAQPLRARPSERPNAMSDTHRYKAELSRIRLLIQSGSMGFGGAYEQARTLFPDPEELALVLAGLREDHEIDAGIRAQIDTALAALIRQHGHAHLAIGLNTRHVVDAFASLMGVSERALRQAYRTLIGATAGESVTYRHLIDAFGFSRRGLVLDFLEQALAADIASDTPTHPPEEFQPLLALLFQLRLLRSADAVLLLGAGHQRRRRTKNRSDDTPDLFDQAVIDLLLACLSDIQEGCRHFTHCLTRWQAFAGEDGVSAWAGRILRAMADVPTELFPDLAYRQALLTSLSEVTDELFRSRRGDMARLRSPHV